MKRNSSLFNVHAIIIGMVTGISSVIFNESAYSPMFGQIVLNNYLLIAASLVLAAIGVFSRQLTQSRFGELLTSFVGGAMLGIIVVACYYHWGQGIVALVIPFFVYMMRKGLTTPASKY